MYEVGDFQPEASCLGISGHEFRDLFQIPRALLSIFVTNRCNFLCGHCCTESGPSTMEALDLKTLSQALYSLSPYDNVQGIHVSGGEPFMAPELLAEISAYAIGKQLLFGVNTNGFWVRSRKLRKALQTKLAGITNIFFSFSKWHGEFLSPHEMHDAVSCALDAGKVVDLVIAYEFGSSEADCGILLEQIFPNGIPEKLNVTSGQIEPLGRAANLKLHAPVVADTSSASGCWQTNRPVIHHNGSFLFCCNTVNFDEGAFGLELGNVKDVPLSELLRRHKNDALVIAISEFGPQLLSELLNQGVPDEKSWISMQARQCATCKNLLSSVQSIERARELGKGLLGLTRPTI